MILLTLILIPSLMLSDYYLTLLGEKLRQRSQPQCLFRIESYELNPFFQKDVARLRWINWRHISLTILLTLVMAFLAVGYVYQVSPVPFIALLGYYSVFYGVVIGRHINNILIFSDALKAPQLGIDQIPLEQKPIVNIDESIKLVQMSNAALLPPFGLSAALTRSEFMIGGFCGILALFAVHWYWLKWYQFKQRKASQRAV